MILLIYPQMFRRKTAALPLNLITKLGGSGGLEQIHSMLIFILCVCVCVCAERGRERES